MWALNITGNLIVNYGQSLTDGNVAQNSAEDCLSLAIWTPANVTADSKLPVVLYWTGGGDNTGGVNIPTQLCTLHGLRFAVLHISAPLCSNFPEEDLVKMPLVNRKMRPALNYTSVSSLQLKGNDTVQSNACVQHFRLNRLRNGWPGFPACQKLCQTPGHP